MSNYAIEADMVIQFGEEQLLIASDRDGSGVSDPSVIVTALTAASQEMDSYIQVRYDLPLQETPGMLKHMCCDIAMYIMSFDGQTLTESKTNRYNDHKKWLMSLSKGLVVLGEVEEDEGVQDVPTITSETRQFTRSKLRGVF